MAGPKDLHKASKICYRICDKYMVELAWDIVTNMHQGVFMVVEHTPDQYRFKDELVLKGINPDDIFLAGIDGPINLTIDRVERGLVHDYSIVITRVRFAEGYTLTHLSNMITGVYPSNNAVRTQLEGRINRIGQRAEVINYYTVHTGILTNILKSHMNAKALQKALEDMADKIGGLV